MAQTGWSNRPRNCITLIDILSLALLPFGDVKPPIGQVEQEEGDREYYSRVFVDDINVLDLGDDGLEDGLAFIQLRNHAPLARSRAPSARSRGRSLDPEAGGESLVVEGLFGGESVPDARDGRETEILQFNDVLLDRVVALLSGGLDVDGVPLLLFLLLLLLLLLLGPGAPVGVVDGCVLQQSCEDEHEAHHQVDVYSLHVRNSGQRRAHARADGCHCQHRCDACKDNDVGTNSEGYVLSTFDVGKLGMTYQTSRNILKWDNCEKHSVYIRYQSRISTTSKVGRTHD